MKHQKQNPAVEGGVSCNPSQVGSHEITSNIRREQQASRDELYIFLPGIDDTEYRQRANLRSKRNCAALLISNTDSETARALAWQCANYVTALIYSVADSGMLEEVNDFCRRLMVLAMQAEAIDAAWESGAL